MKKVMIILGVFCVLSILGFGYISYLYSNSKKDNLKLENEFETLNNNIYSTNKINADNGLELEKLKEANKEAIEELELWKQMKEKVTKAL